MALVGRGDGEAAEVKNSSGEVLAGDELLEVLASFLGREMRRVDDGGYADGVFVEEGFAAEAFFAEKKAVVGGEDDEGVFGEAELFELSAQRPDKVVYGGVGPGHL